MPFPVEVKIEWAALFDNKGFCQRFWFHLHSIDAWAVGSEEWCSGNSGAPVTSEVPQYKTTEKAVM